MVRLLHRLSARFVASATTPGRHADGGGLYLVVETTGSRRWAFIYRWKETGAKGSGRLREMGLGSATVISLAKARDRAAAAREQLADRIDPIEAKRAVRIVPTFGEVADEVIATRAKSLRSEKSVALWKRALVERAADLRGVPVDRIDTAAIVSVLKPMWSTTPEMAHKTRGYLEAVMDAARAKGWRSGDNPARWRGHLDQLLPKRTKLSRGHHAAMAFDEVPAFLRELKARDGIGARALEFTILTAVRSGEALGSRWAEIDMKASLWIIPASRMKSSEQHRVPLTPAALAVLDEMQAIRCSDFVFPGERAGKAISSGTMERVLDRMGRGEVTVHGFRSSFRDWSGERTEFPREVAEAALAHVAGDQTERAYRRGDALERRRSLMAGWAQFCMANDPVQ
jgi:integrase